MNLNKEDLLSPNNIYYSPSIKRSRDINWFIEFLGLGYSEEFNEQEKEYLTINYHIREYIDHRRGIEVTSIWFNSIPTMIVLRAGRELRDETKAVVTDAVNYQKMIKYIYYLKKESIFDYPIVDAKEPLESISVIYNQFTKELLEDEV